jgi:hypothetical protein
MEAIMLQETDRFSVVADDGRRWVLFEYTDLMDTTSTGGFSLLPGVKRYQTRDETTAIPTNIPGEFRLFPDGPTVRKI